MIPLIVSFSYDELMSIKIFSVINMCLHLICAIYAIIRWKKVTINDEFDFYFSLYISFFMIFFPVIIIPIFWMMIIINTKYVFDTISIIFLTLFGTCLASSLIFAILLVMEYWMSAFILDKLWGPVAIICFYVPNVLQILLITLNWPINFYFVKACIFILVLSLTRNVTYYSDKVPKNFLATSTTATQCMIKYILKESVISDIFKETRISMDEMQEKMQITIDGMQKTMQTKIDEMEKTMQTKIDEIQKTINEMKISMDETNKKIQLKNDHV
jgi:hypothetical protein